MSHTAIQYIQLDVIHTKELSSLFKSSVSVTAAALDHAAVKL
jgi:hypothetical protein